MTQTHKWKLILMVMLILTFVHVAGDAYMKAKKHTTRIIQIREVSKLDSETMQIIDNATKNYAETVEVMECTCCGFWLQRFQYENMNKSVKDEISNKCPRCGNEPHWYSTFFVRPTFRGF